MSRIRIVVCSFLVFGLLLITGGLKTRLVCVSSAQAAAREAPPPAPKRRKGEGRGRAVQPAVAVFTGPRYTARWVDETVTRGDDLSAWNTTDAQPTLGGKKLLDAAHPVRWLRNNSVGQSTLPVHCVEFVGGDCLPGSVTSYQTAVELPAEPEPAHLVFEPALRLDLAGMTTRDTLRLLPAFMTRVVWQRQADIPLQPGTVFFRNGREITFRSLRWEAEGIKLLTADGLVSAAFGELAELHFPRQDSWEAHLNRLAVLTPDRTGRLMQVESSDGMVATTSLVRFQARSAIRGTDAGDWIHMIQPAWSLDAMFVPHSKIRQWTFFSAYELPLTWIEPTASSHRAVFSTSWNRYRVNANVQGDPLINDGLAGGWGLGVHAEHVLEYPLPPFAGAFRTQMGLDQAAGNGGCARGRIMAGSAGSDSIFVSKDLIGSSAHVDTLRLPLPDSHGQAARLKLFADAVWSDRPAGADPLDVRDVFDWIEPIVELSPQPLETELARHAETALPGLSGWKIHGMPGKDWQLVNSSRSQERPAPRFRLAIRPISGPLRLTRTFNIRQETPNLMLLAAKSSDRMGAVRVEARVNGQVVGTAVLPEYRSDGWLRPIAIDLHELVGNEAAVELSFIPTGSDAAIEWHAGALVDQVPEAENRKR